MTCYRPLSAYRSHELTTKNNKRKIKFLKHGDSLDKEHLGDDYLEIPCGQCIGCRIERSRQWAIRCVHEASLYENNCFITLTFSDEYLPKDKSLNVRHWQLFMKRLREKFGENIRFYHCGEYGEKFGRPHYHACLFNFDFPDKKLWKVTTNGHRIYTSEALSKLWGQGFCTIGDVTFESAAYVARYIMKKVNGSDAEEHYQYIDPETGQIFQRKPEYTTMSRRPGIAKAWFDKYYKDVYPGDFVVLNGKKMRPPRYYDTQYEIAYPSDHEKLKETRKVNLKKYVDNNTKERLNVREQVQLLRLKKLIRPLDQELQYEDSQGVYDSQDLYHLRL